MHRTNPMLRIVLGLILLGLVLSARSPAGAAPADEQPAQAPRAAIPITIPLGSTRTLDMKGKEIQTVNNEFESVAEVRPGTDLSHVRVTGRSVGQTRITLTAADGKATEVYLVTVEFDVEYLRNVLQRTVPSANINLTAVGGGGTGGAVVIAGDAGPAENVNLIMRIAESMVGQSRVINAMRVNGIQQVQLDVVVALVSRSEARRMAFDFWDGGLHHDLVSNTGGAITMPSSVSGALSAGQALTFVPLVGQQNSAPPNFYFGLYNQNQTLLTFLQILRNENLAKLLAEPRLLTTSGRAATFLSGGEQAVPSPGGLGAVSVQFIPFGTRLTFLPYVLNNGKIYMEVEPEVSQLSQANGTSVAGTAVAGRTTQRVHTSIEMEDGQTFVIGGMIQHNVNGTANKVPVLGDLPFIGAAFSSKTYTEDETEMLVLVTPHLVDAMSCNQTPKVLPGQETRSPDDFELFLEGILEAPRGPRHVNSDRRYVPAYKNGPTAATFPCAGPGANGCSGPGCAGSGLANGSTMGYPNGASVGNPPDKLPTGPASGTDLGLPLDLPDSTGSATPAADPKPIGEAQGLK
jgi:pilus assembly protein CpaC